MKFQKPSFIADASFEAQQAMDGLQERYRGFDLSQADVIVALGGDGFMLDVLNEFHSVGLPLYGINQGTVGFLMNQVTQGNLIEKLNLAEESVIHPLKMSATKLDGSIEEALAINEVSLLRGGSQAAKLKIAVDDLVRLEELICDGVLVSTSAGSTAYNLSAHGSILPLDSNILALTPISAFRPRRWRGALLSETNKIELFIIDNKERSSSVTADNIEFRNIEKVEIESSNENICTVLFDSKHSIEDKILNEQFNY